ncbi:fibropellin-3-like isoform X2 [Asterias amurensis]|uniref:fibropellin-3-like isoform X2 n=1 Tax=Asterias amurensis TaxID=7602 RepID=UPI003AB4DAEE
MHPMKPVAVFSLLLALLVAGANGEECETNRCPGNERCLTRDVPGLPNYVCECTQTGYMGYNCEATSNTKTINTCYGDQCKTGNFSSPNYFTTGYTNGEDSLYLIYIPRATEIRFTFASTFQIERNADELYVGEGLVIPYFSLALNNIPPHQYFFDGFGAPSPFSVYNDTVWMYFTTDRGGGTYQGFQIFWNATVADPPTTIPMTTESVASSNVSQSGFIATLIVSVILAISSGF